MTDQQMGLQARLMSKALRKITGKKIVVIVMVIIIMMIIIITIMMRKIM